MIDQIKIGKFIAAKRKEKSITQAEVAESLGITDRAVSKWERGLALPDASITLNLCSILGISIAELLTGEKKICQSCGMEMDESLYGTHGDGHKNTEYCIHCFKDGLFTVSSMEEQIEINTSPEGLEDFNKASGLNLSKDEAVLGLRQYLPTLKRWMKTEEQASWILDHTGYVTLSTIDEEGFPRPVAIDVIAHDGIKTIWMTTFRDSNKARQLMKNPKAGISFVHEADSVTLTGIAEIITDSTILHEFWKDAFIHYYTAGPDDENYCLIRFTTLKAICWIDSEKKESCF